MEIEKRQTIPLILFYAMPRKPWFGKIFTYPISHYYQLNFCIHARSCYGIHFCILLICLFIWINILERLLKTYGTWVYAILFIIVFCETGLVVTPFLPGDSLLFAAGTFAGMGKMHVSALFFLLFTAAFLGDNVNYWIGRYIGSQGVSLRKQPVFQKGIFGEDASIL